MARFKISYNNKFIVDKEATGNIPVIYNGKFIGDVVEGKNRALSCANTKAEGRILIGDTILDCKNKYMNTDILVAYFDDSNLDSFPEEPTDDSAYELINTYTNLTTFTATEYGWYQIELHGASGKGGKSATKYALTPDEYLIALSSAGGGGGGGGAYSCSRVKMSIGDTIVFGGSVAVGSTATVVVNSSIETYDTMKAVSGKSGSAGTVDNYLSRGTGGAGGTGGKASGGNYKNINGDDGTTGQTNIKIDGTNFNISAAPGGAPGHVDGNTGGAGGDTLHIYDNTGAAGSEAFIKIYRSTSNVEELAPPVSDVLEENDWATISEISKSGTAQNYWSVGDTKTFTCGNYTMTAQIIGFDHDDVTDSTGYGRTKAGITFQTVECYPTAYAWSSSNVPWKTSTTRVTNLPAILNTMTDVKDYIVPVNKEATKTIDKSGVEIVSDNLFLLSTRELDATKYIKNEEGSQYSYYAAGNSKIKKANGNTVGWWTRSEREITETGENGRDMVTVLGTIGTQTVSRSSKEYYAFGFCL